MNIELTDYSEFMYVYVCYQVENSIIFIWYLFTWCNDLCFITHCTWDDTKDEVAPEDAEDKRTRKQEVEDGDPHSSESEGKTQKSHYSEIEGKTFFVSVLEIIF